MYGYGLRLLCGLVVLKTQHHWGTGQDRIVKLGRLGNFQVGISSEGKEAAADVSSSAIKKSRILFRPGKKLRTLLNDLSFRKAG
ncbi:hypothetical protein IWX80_002204 [Flavobacterium sp. CAN_S2]